MSVLSITQPVNLTAYLDSNWAGDINDHCSTIGYCIFLGNLYHLRKKKKNPIFSHSSAKAEYLEREHNSRNHMASSSSSWDGNLALIVHPLYCDNINTNMLPNWTFPCMHQTQRDWLSICCQHLRQCTIILCPISYTDQLVNYSKSYLSNCFNHLTHDLSMFHFFFFKW